MTPQEIHVCLSFRVFLEEEAGQRYVGGSEITLVLYVKITTPEHTGGAVLCALTPAQQAPGRDAVESVRPLVWLFVLHNSIPCSVKEIWLSLKNPAYKWEGFLDISYLLLLRPERLYHAHFTDEGIGRV